MIYPWQQQQWQYLLARRENNTLPHALLLRGAQGIGKFQFAQNFAKLMLCEQAKKLACGNCRSCHLFTLGHHPDLFVVQPEQGKNIKIDQIRQLTENLNKTSQQGSFQMVIIEPAEGMNIAAANALLKTLEEPQGKVIISLVSHQLTNLPATIRSRCQAIVFQTTDKSAIKNWLQSQVTNEQDVDSLLAHVEYAPLTALSLSKQETTNVWLQLIDTILKLETNKPTPIKIATNFVDTDLKQLLNQLLIFIAAIIRYKVTNISSFFVSEDKTAQLKKISKKKSLIGLFQFYDKVLDAARHTSKNINLNQQLLLESLFIDWCAES